MICSKTYNCVIAFKQGVFAVLGVAGRLIFQRTSSDDPLVGPIMGFLTCRISLRRTLPKKRH